MSTVVTCLKKFLWRQQGSESAKALLLCDPSKQTPADFSIYYAVATG
jgi:hypothetical protein